MRVRRNDARSADGSQSLRFLRSVFVLVGGLLVSLSVILPILMVRAIEHRGVTAAFGAGYLSALTPFITIASMASSFISAAVILSFEKSRPSRVSALLGITTLFVLGVELVLSVYVSIIHLRSPTAPGPLAIYILIGLVPFGLACTLFILASIISEAAVSNGGKA